VADQGPLSGPDLWRRNARRSAAAMLTANGVAAIVVFVYLSWIVPVPSVSNTELVTLVNTGVFLACAAVGFPIGARAGLRRAQRIRVWLAEDRPPTPSERDEVLRLPWRQARFLARLWALAAVIFFVVNVGFSVGLAFEIAVTILLGGVVTSTLGYLLIERINRSSTARALAIGPPQRPVGPGVRARVMLSWTIGTAVFLLTAAALTLAVLIDPSFTTLRRVSASVLFLSVGGIAVGALTMGVAARSVADPLESVRSALRDVEAGSSRP
jgi:adenylate cyclase